jgi:hypothetical protein
MKYRRRVFFTDKQKSEIWDIWQSGELMSSIGRVFDRASSLIYPLPCAHWRRRLCLRASVIKGQPTGIASEWFVNKYMLNRDVDWSVFFTRAFSYAHISLIKKCYVDYTRPV